MSEAERLIVEWQRARSARNAFVGGDAERYGRLVMALFEAENALARFAPAPSPLPPARSERTFAPCSVTTPANESGHWRETHRGHGCINDPEKPGSRTYRPPAAPEGTHEEKGRDTPTGGPYCGMCGGVYHYDGPCDPLHARPK